MELYILMICVFCSITIFTYKFIPDLLRRHTELQHKRLEKASKSMRDHMIDVEERRRLVTKFSVIPLVLGLAGFMFFHNLIGLLAGLAVGLILPPIIIKNIPAKRINKFHSQFVDGLMLISSSMKAGLNLNQAFEILAEELPAPIGEEFDRVVKENKMGMPLHECLAHLKRRIPLDDLGMMVTAVNIAQETGGDLAEVFDELVVTISEKKKLEDKVRTLTVQGRLQGIIMSILPVAFGAFVYFTNPHNFDIMFKHKVGQTLLIYAFFSQLVGIFLIKKLSKVEV